MNNKYNTLLVETTDRVCKIFLNKPESRNALDMEMRAELADVIDAVSRDPAVRVLVLSGKGKAFCAGGDLKTMNQPFPPFTGRQRLKDLHVWLKKLINLEIPVVAAVNGVAAGAGFNLALACDIVIASAEAKFTQSFIKVGLVPDAAGFYFLPRAVGLSKAKELMFTGKLLGAHEAETLGIVNKVVAAEELGSYTDQLAKELAYGPGKAMAMIKRLLNLSLSSDLETVLEFEAMAQDMCFGTEDFLEGKQAFLEKRKPSFKP